MATMHAPTLASDVLMNLGPLEIRNTVLMAWIGMAFLILLALFVASTRYKRIPGRFQTAVEMVIEGIFGLANSVLQDPKLSRRVFPVIATFFLYILFSNWLGILPGVGSITVMHNGYAVPLLRSLAADVNTTLAFALISVIMTQAIGIATIGILPYAGKYIVMPWHKPYGIGTFVGLLEFIGEFARLVSFAFRLFGNIFAGEVLLVVIFYLAPYIVPIPFLGMELFVGVVQALVFTMLTLVFLKMAVTAHGDHGSEAGHAAHA